MRCPDDGCGAAVRNSLVVCRVGVVGSVAGWPPVTRHDAGQTD